MLLFNFWDFSFNVFILCYVLFKFSSEKKKCGSYRCVLCWEASFAKKWVKHAGTDVLNIQETETLNQKLKPKIDLLILRNTRFLESLKKVLHKIVEHVTTSPFFFFFFYLASIYEKITRKLENPDFELQLFWHACFWLWYIEFLRLDADC